MEYLHDNSGTLLAKDMQSSRLWGNRWHVCLLPASSADSVCQDAVEFFQYLLTTLDKQEKKVHVPTDHDSNSLFNFNLQQRLQCTSCNGVKYSNVTTSMLSLVIPDHRLPPTDPDDKTIHWEAVKLESCLQRPFEQEQVELRCSECAGTTFLK